MQAKDFNAVVDSRIGFIRSILTQKGKEYATEFDRLHNFKVAARFNGRTPELALWGMMVKHLVSIYDLIDGIDAERGTYRPDAAMWHEKLGDAINYLILLEGLITERVHATCEL